MIYQGKFYDNKGIECAVYIQIDGTPNTTIHIGDDNNGIYFDGEEPVTIDETIDDTFEHIIKKSCTINFVTKNYKGVDFFAKNARTIKVLVYKDNRCVFAGYVEPNTYTQPWGENVLDSFSINAVDYLSTLENYQYSGITKDTQLATAKTIADKKTFKELIQMMFADFMNINFVGDGGTPHIWYDLSKATVKGREAQLFDDLAISESYLIGDELDDVWNYEDILNELLKYTNLHIVQDGLSYYVFDWNTLKNKRTTWKDILSNTTHTFTPQTITIENDLMMDSSTNITVNDVYSQIKLTDKVEDVDNIITNPLDDDSLYSPYNSKYKYCLEMIAEGDGDRANGSINRQVKGEPTDYDGGYQYEWYVQPMLSKNWSFKTLSGGTLVPIENFFEKDSNGTYYKNWSFPHYMRHNQCVPCIIKEGYVKKQSEKEDNSLVSSINMDKYLYISINGNEKDTQLEHSPSDNQLSATRGIIEYVGANTGAIYTPVDNSTNYIVFKGELILQPITYESNNSKYAQKDGTYWRCYQNGVTKTEFGGSGHETNTIHFDKLSNSDGAYYVRKFWNHNYASEQPKDTTIATNVLKNDTSLQPYSDQREVYKYKYNSTKYNSGTDTISKLPILCCEMTIGNKRLIEIAKGNHDTQFKWVEIGKEPNGTDGKPITTFSLGVNPKIGDSIIGTSFKLQNTIDYSMGLDVEGTAIPIRKEDKLNGKMTFKILGAYQTLWNNANTKTGLFSNIYYSEVNHQKDDVYILSHVENIVIKQFECKIVSDNGGLEITESNDLIYQSNEDEECLTKKDDIEFKFITQLSANEAFAKGVKNTINVNSVQDEHTGYTLKTLYNATTNEVAKPEEHYIDQYYNAYNKPKIILETSIDDGFTFNWRNQYKEKYLNKTFFIQSKTWDLANKKITLKLKEI